MKLNIAIAGVCAAMIVSSPAMAMTDAECMTEWKAADLDNDGVLTETEGSRFHAALRVSGKPVVDGKLTAAQYMEYCKADAFVRAKTEPGAPLKGANSFTEAQARDRILASGYLNVSGLQKDDDGIWRGTATDGSKAVKISVDYKGNVVPTG